MTCHQKEFIAHENCQQVLHSSWLDDWQDWRGMSFPTKLFRIFTKVAVFPAFTAVYLVVPQPMEWLQRYMNPPIHRYILSTISYISFLTLLFIETNHDRDVGYRGGPRSGLEILIVLFVLGHCWEYSKKFQTLGSKTFLAAWWNWYELMNITLFISTFFVWYWASERSKTVPRLPRMEWEWNEPDLIAEGLFGFSIILSFGKLLQIFRVSYWTIKNGTYWLCNSIAH